MSHTQVCGKAYVSLCWQSWKAESHNPREGCFFGFIASCKSTQKATRFVTLVSAYPSHQEVFGSNDLSACPAGMSFRALVPLCMSFLLCIGVRRHCCLAAQAPRTRTVAVSIELCSSMTLKMRMKFLSLIQHPVLSVSSMGKKVDGLG